LHYIIYKTTNLINGKYYIGKHQTNDLNDGYVGSGKYLKRAINKYGIHNFHTEIIEIYDEEWKMNIAEKILVVIDSEISYNLCPGGKGGFGYLNKNKLSVNFFTKENGKKFNKLAIKKLKELRKNDEFRAKISKTHHDIKRIKYASNVDIDALMSIDFTKEGWSKKLKPIANVVNTGRWLKCYFPELWKNAWRKNNK